MQRDPAAVSVRSVSVSYLGAPAAVDAVSLDAAPGSITALLGPSGCGKTSLLRAIAGLERPTDGSIVIGEREVSGHKTWVKPEHRGIGMVFQDGALFPHLSVADNIAFGLRGTRTSRGAQRARIEELLDLVDLGGLGERIPETLSGGQQQRVALARSLAPSPSVLLLDEPFSALDAGLRVQVRAEVVKILREVGVTSIFVTHDQDEAFVLGDQVAVMRSGRIEQLGEPDELYRKPINKWVASFVGEANFVASQPGDGPHCVDSPLGRIPLAEPVDSFDSLDVLVRPEQVAMSNGDMAEITTVEYYGHDVRYELELRDGTRLSARAHPDHLRQRGERVDIAFDGDAAVATFTND